MEPFQYTSFSDPRAEIRLVTIAPGDPDSPLKLTLKIYNTSDPALQYRALSYAWGPPNIPKVSIIINDHGFEILPNLETALKRIRNARMYYQEGPADGEDTGIGTEPIWVDAICINQRDIPERNEQVRWMDKIYRDALLVIVYLGDFQESSDMDVETIVHNLPPVTHQTVRDVFALVRLISVVWHEPSFGIKASKDGNKDIINNQLVRCLRNGSYKSPDLTIHKLEGLNLWGQLSKLFHRTWFERLWVFQELGNARLPVVLWGDLALPWNDLYVAAFFTLVRGESSYRFPALLRQNLVGLGGDRVTQFQQEAFQSTTLPDIVQKLQQTASAKYTDARDKLFAIRSLVAHGEDIEVNYGINVETVYRTWAKNRILRTRGLDILGVCSSSTAVEYLPSWVPDLRQPGDEALWYTCFAVSRDDSGLVTRHENPRMLLESIPPNPKSPITFSDDSLKLSVPGYRISTVVAISPKGGDIFGVTGIHDLAIRITMILKNWENWLLAQGHTNYSDQLWRVLLRTRESSTTPQTTVDNTANKKESYQYCLSMFEDIYRDGNVHRRAFRDLRLGIASCQLFSIEEAKSFGVVSNSFDVVLGDEIYLLQGGWTPFILRKVQGGYRVIGPVYLAGWMDGVENRERLALEHHFETVVLI